MTYKRGKIGPRALKPTVFTCGKAITKIHSIRGHAEGFAENNMIHNAATGKPPDLVTTWSTFSVLHDPQTIEDADWGDRKKRLATKHSKKLFDITEFHGQESSQCEKRNLRRSRNSNGRKPAHEPALGM